MTRARREAERLARLSGYRSLADLALAEARRRRIEKMEYAFNGPENRLTESPDYARTNHRN